jgi:hypothetical protein
MQTVNFSIISSDLTQDARAAVRGFRILREQTWFKNIDVQDYIVWADCGKHFRNNEMASYLLLELADQKKHGKLYLNYFIK